MTGPELPGLVWAESTDDPPEAWDVLHAEQQAQAQRFCATRRHEFATVRLCAHRALRALGVAETQVRRGPAGQPLWPAGTVGSLTHCRAARAAAVARTATWAGVGIDVEPAAPLPQLVVPFVLSTIEQRRVAQRPVAGPATDRLVFCVKEAVYKACWALGGQRLGFGDADVVLGDDGTVSVTLAARPGRLDGGVPRVGGRPVRQVGGRWMQADGVLRVAVAVAPAG